MQLHYDPVIPLLGIYLKKPEILIQKNICTPVLIATIAKIWKQLKCPSMEEWIKTLWYLYTVEYYLAVKEKEIVPFATVWMDLESIMLNEIGQLEKDKYHMWNLMNKIN